MNEALQGGEAPPKNTSRIMLSMEIDDRYVPAFLKKRKDPGLNEEVHYEAPATVIVEETEAPAPIDEPSMELVEVAEPITVPEPEIQEELEISAANAGSFQPPSDIGELSIEELKQQEEAIKLRIEEKMRAEKAAIIAQIVDVVKIYQISVEDLVEALGGLKVKRKGVKAKTKFRDPVTGALWSGRGKEPSWIKDKDREAFLVP